MRSAERLSPLVGYFDGGASLRAIAVGEVAGEDPRMTGGDPAGRLPVHADFVHRIACKRAIRSSVEGWVENRRIMLWPVNGLMMNMWAVAGEASIGIRFDQVSSFCSPLMRG